MKKPTTKPAKAIITLKTDAVMKVTAQRLADELGITISAVLNRALREFIQEQAVTFRKPLRPTPYLERILRKTRADARVGRNMSPAFNRVEDMVAWLEAPDE